MNPIMIDSNFQTYVGIRPVSSLALKLGILLPEATNLHIEGNPISPQLQKSLPYGLTTYTNLHCSKLNVPINEGFFLALNTGLSNSGSAGLNSIYIYQHNECLAELRCFGKIWLLLVSKSVPIIRLKRIQKELKLFSLPCSILLKRVFGSAITA